MRSVALSQYKVLQAATHDARSARRFCKMLFALISALGYVPGVYAADVGLGITFSPEAAHMIRDWRRANGLPQAPEANEIHAPLDSSNAIEKAIHGAGLQNATRDDLVVAASHLSSHWLVTIHVANTPDDADYVIEVSDAVANSRGASQKHS